jgi:hypothetical protein
MSSRDYIDPKIAELIELLNGTEESNEPEQVPPIDEAVPRTKENRFASHVAAVMRKRRG